VRLGPGIIAVLASASSVVAADLLVRDATLIDGTGTPPRPGVSILVRDGWIAAIGPDVTARDVPVIDARGAVVTPGLIDAHVHLAVVPGMAFRGDSPETLRDLRRAHLRGYLACGVTTILDTAIPLPLAEELGAWLRAGHLGPRLLFLGPGITAAGGYAAAGKPTPTTPEEVEAELDRLVAAGAAGVKVFLEPGFGPKPIWPLPSPEVRAAITRGAAARRLPIYVHANHEEAKATALDMGAHAIVHAGFYGSTPSDTFVARLAASGAYLVTTFAIMDAELTRFHPERLDDRLVRLVVPAIERESARDPAAARFLVRAEIGYVLPWSPGWLRDLIGRVALREAGSAEGLRSAQRAAGRFAAAGVPIVVGTDAGNWDILPYQFHAVSTPREVELLAETGIGPEAALAAATRVAARMLGLEAELGTVEVGKRADLVVLRKRRLASARALRAVGWTVKDGVARTPRGWMTRSE
jgi:imidazolonepropionase-like amidohydrolase